MSIDCVVIGYNETPFPQYEALLRSYGETSGAYRDLKFSMVEIEGAKLSYPALMNYALGEAKRSPAVGDAVRAGDVPNLAAVYLTNALRKHGIAARYVNLFQYEKEELGKLLDEDPVCVAITTTFYVINLPVIEMVEFIRARNPRVKIVVGGPLIANHYRRYPAPASDVTTLGTAATRGSQPVRPELAIALRDLGADLYVIESQGEATLARLVECLRTKGDLREVTNLFFTDDSGELRQTRVEAESNDLDAHTIEWGSFPEMQLGPTLQTRTARSCAFSCSFCAYPTRAGKLTLAALPSIDRELAAMHALGNVRNVVFIDDTFNVPIERFKEFCRMLLERGYGFDWYCYFRCGNADEEAIELMARAGCKGVFLGIESGSNRILKHMHKAAVVDKYVRGIGLLKQYGILTFGSFITGFPGETTESVDETIAFIRHTELDYWRSQLWYCEPGTKIYEQREEFGIEGEGFRWRHRTMDSKEAMDHIERMFFAIDVESSVWMPQWSFDFWFIPYITGKGISLEQFKEFMVAANKLLRLELGAPADRQRSRDGVLRSLVGSVSDWELT